MSLAEILKNNAEFVGSGRGATRPATGRTLVVTDSGPELSGLVLPALGLAPGEASVIRIAGAWGGDGGKELFRSLATALYLYDCRQVFVIGQSDCKCCPASRSTLRKNMKRAGLLDKLPDEGDDVLTSLRGPASIEAAVSDTVELLREKLVADDVPVYGCLLDVSTGALRVIDGDSKSDSPERIAQASTIAQASEDDIADVSLPDLPEIALPQIPGFDLDALTATPAEPKAKKPSAAAKAAPARSVAGAGPVSFDEMAKMPGDFASGKGAVGIRTAQDVFQIPKIEFSVPEGAKIQDTGLQPAKDIIAKPDISAEADIKPVRPVDSTRQAPARARRETPRPPRPRPRPRRSEPERPAVTPVVRSAPAQRPLGEREISFGRDESTPTADDSRAKRVRVNLSDGYVQQGDSEFPIDSQLQDALLKVAQFLGAEFSGQQRRNLINSVRRGASGGQSVGELLKVVIGPVLKLGKKRYAIINELLKMKEELPRQDPEIAEALIEGILSNR